MSLYHGCTFGCAAQLHGHAYRSPVYINASADSPVHTVLQRHGQLACPRQLTNVTADSPVRTGLARHGRFTRE